MSTEPETPTTGLPHNSLVLRFEMTDLETGQVVVAHLVCLKTILRQQVTDCCQTVKAQAHISLDTLLSRLDDQLCIIPEETTKVEEAGNESEQH
jgi:hypothetical protein